MFAIEKPTLLLDWDRMLRNIERMADKAVRSGVRLRPHFKTHQSAEIGEAFRPYGVTGITVSSLDMAESFADAGWKDILVAFPVNLRQINQINTLAKQTDLQLLVDSSEAIAALASGLRAPVAVWIKVDTGLGRAGVPADNTELLISLARQIGAADLLQFQGLLTHAGHTYHADTKEHIQEIYSESVVQLRRAGRSLEGAGLGPVLLSTGDTPGCNLCDDLSGVDEIRPGNFVFHDAMQLQMGSCTEQDIAVAVACPIVSKQPDRGILVIYGGAVHLSLAHLKGPDGVPNYGNIALGSGRGWGKIIDGPWVSSLTQEHGLVRADQRFIEQVEIGDILYIIPIHSCITVNCLRRYRTLSGQWIECTIR